MCRLHCLLRPILLLVTIFVWTLVIADQTTAGDSTQVAVSTDDGPHVFWSADTSAIVFYYCDDSVISQPFPVRDTLRFSGFCKDVDFAYVVPAHVAGPGPDEISGVGKIFALSDLHGDYAHFTEVLINSGIVDSSLHWAWGRGHLVIDGDVFDRGPAVTECLWLIYRLEIEAAHAGGAVHFLLGNHELMVLRGDLRYVHERYTNGIARRNRFVYHDLFGPDMALGRWLRTRQTVLRINRTLFVHGGVSVESLQDRPDLSEINQLVRQGLDYTAPRLFFDSLVRHAYGSFGPLWYRGYTRALENSYPALSAIEIDSILAFLDADQIVVGHSEQDSLVTLHDGKVIAIDVDVETLGGQQGLLWEADRFYRVDRLGAKRSLQTE